jgi:Ca2+-binding RTX toxin-like protein
MASLPRFLAAAAAATALLPATAGASTITSENGGLVYRGEGAEGVTLIVSSVDYDGVHYLRFDDFGKAKIQTDLCRRLSYEDSALCDFSPTRPITILGSDGRDSLSLSSADDVPDSIPITIDGRGGDDTIKDAYNGLAGRTLSGGAGNDEVDGAGGDDTIEGGDGNDIVDGGPGNDAVHGGNGDDVMWGDHFKSPGADLLDGGPGTDTIDEWNIPDGDFHPLPTVSLNGLADDGRPGEGDNVQSVERYTFHLNATFTGSDAAETIEVSNVHDGSSNIDGGGGNDVIKADDTSDTVNGGAGDDVVEGGLGNDTVTGGPGKDTIMGDSSASHCQYFGSCKVPFGNDTIYAQDGEPDQIDCGVGEDVAYVDAVDTVANCETVNRTGAAAGGGAGPGTAPAPGAPADGGKRAGLSLVGAASVKALLAGRLTIGVPCAGACRVALRAKAGGRTVATGRATLLAAGTAKVKLKLSPKARRALKRSQRLEVTVTATVTAADGTRQRLSRALTLK